MTHNVSRHALAASAPLALALAVASVFPSAACAQSTAERVVVTAARMPQSAKDVLSDHLVITAEEIELAGQGSITDLLQQKRGIEITRTGGVGNTASVFIRGAANAQNVVLVDGVRIGSSTLGGATWETIPLSQVERIEIVYGPLSSLYGADAMGGVIQIFTKQGDGAPRLSAAAGVGGFKTRNLEAGIGGSTGVATTFRYALQAARETSDGFSASKPGAGLYTYNPDKDGYTRESASGRIGVEYAKGHEAGISFINSKLDVQFDAGAGHDDRMIQKLENVAFHSKNRFAPNWSSRLQLARSADKGYTDASYGRSDINTKQTQASWQNDIAFGTDVLQLVAERRVEKVEPATAAQAGKRTTNSFAGSYQLKRGSHLASASLRHDRNSQFGSHSTGSLEYGYRFAEAWRANVSYGTSFRAPTFNDLYYPGYGVASNRPESGKNAEVGLHYNTGATHASAVYYRNRFTDLITYAPVCPVEQSTHPYGCAYNVNEAVLSGWSLSADTKLGNLALRAAFDLQDPRDKTTDKLLPRRAKKHGSLGAEYGAHAYKVGAELVFSGARFDDFGNRNRLAGYGLLNLYANYQFALGWNLFGRWNNVADKDYELARNYATPGSNVFVGVRYSMK
ncbi:MAG TPA: TonB-dependent receptor [Paucimonas sp.]|nr:TonB-dependent receptor [Paucimonas sp.]